MEKVTLVFGIFPFGFGGGDSGKTQNTTKSAPRKLKMSKKELRNVGESIDKLLFSVDDSPVAAILTECAVCKKEIGYLRPLAENARKVTEAYYQPDRIRDMLLKFNQFVDEVENVRNVEIARAKGYCNYIFYVEHEVKKLAAAGWEMPVNMPCLPAVEKADIIEFIESDCAHVNTFSDLNKAKTQASEILERPPEKLTKADYDNYCSMLELTNDMDSLTEQLKAELLPVKESFENQRNALKNNIASADMIYKRITEHITQEWIDGINYELDDCPINTMSVAEIKNYLSEKAEILKNVMFISGGI